MKNFENKTWTIIAIGIYNAKMNTNNTNNMMRKKTKKKSDHAWENVEDVNGMLQAVTSQESLYQNERLKRKRTLEKANVPQNIRRGIIRYLQIIVDLSESVVSNDLKPTRLQVLKEELDGFVTNYFDQNPLSEVGLITTKNQTAEVKVSFEQAKSLRGNFLKNQLGTTGEGRPSLQNALELAIEEHKRVPPYGTREILIIQNALCTNDPGDIKETIQKLINNKIRVNIIGLGAEMYICRKIAMDSDGTYEVALNQQHLRMLISNLQVPPPIMDDHGGKYARRIPVGFPTITNNSIVLSSTNSNNNANLTKVICQPYEEYCNDGFKCPKCESHIKTELPYKCNVCNLFLLSSPHLCRSYHHLFGIEPFEEVTTSELGRKCYCCGMSLDNKLQMQCMKCKKIFSSECEIYIRKSLHNCPGCCQ